MTTTQQALDVEVAVIGGGAAGLTAAIMLSRFRRSVVVVDAGSPRNAPAQGVHNFLSRDGMPAEQLLAVGREELQRLGGQALTDTATTATKHGDTFLVTLRSGRQVRARRLVVASGVSDELPDVAGLSQRWGRDVLHCPYCHGWEVRDQRIGVLATGPAAVHQAMMFRELSEDIILFTHTADPLTDEQNEQLRALGIDTVPGRVAGLHIVDDALTGIGMDDGRVIDRQALVIAPQTDTRSPVLEDLGALRDTGGAGGYVSDAFGATNIVGVWVAGNVADPFGSVVAASAQGMAAAAALNSDIIAERLRTAVAARRSQPFSAESEARVCELVTGDRRHGLAPVSR